MTAEPGTGGKMQNGANLRRGRDVDINELRKKEGVLAQDVKVVDGVDSGMRTPDGDVIKVVFAAAGQRPNGQFTMLRSDDEGYILLSEESIETIALRVVELLREKR